MYIFNYFKVIYSVFNEQINIQKKYEKCSKKMVGVFVCFFISKLKHLEKQNIPVSDSGPCNVLFNVNLIHNNVISVFYGLNVQKTTNVLHSSGIFIYRNDQVRERKITMSKLRKRLNKYQIVRSCFDLDDIPFGIRCYQLTLSIPRWTIGHNHT